MKIAVVLAAIAAGALSGCSDSGETGPYIEVVGGGFQFNYRIAEATMTLVAYPLRTLPEGSIVETSFEDPAGGPALIVAERTAPAKTKFLFVSPPLSGIEADKPYLVTLRVLDADGKELQKIETPYHSQLDQSVLPEKPLVVGPAYTPNPELKPR